MKKVSNLLELVKNLTRISTDFTWTHQEFGYLCLIENENMTLYYFK